MIINKKYYKILGFKKNLRKKISFFCQDIPKSYKNLFDIKNTKFKKHKISCCKIKNKITKKIIQNSIFNYKLSPLLNNSIFLIKFDLNNVLVKLTLVNLCSSFFCMLIFKLNNKIYSFSKVNNSHSLNYFQNKQLITNFIILKLKQTNFIKK